MEDDALPEENSMAVVAEKLSRLYPMGTGEVIGVRDVDLRVRSGELLVIKGESGSGKSTLLSLLAGLDRPTNGSLRVGGLDLETASPGLLTEFRRNTIGIVFQSFNLLPTLTVLENVCLPALLAGKPGPRVRRRAVELLDWLGMARRSPHFPSQLSGGEMQRTAIARALINEPSIIIADEPTGNLDSRNGTAVIELLGVLNRELGRTVIIATHGTLADHLATAGIRLHDGSIVER
ncbi:MAG: ABC transporter ATP-binding protein [Desulfobacteraceae bacterium]|nr:ABC transporter ATP-binding protein [Desulfobacteraceae bacterium]